MPHEIALSEAILLLFGEYLFTLKRIQ